MKKDKEKPIRTEDNPVIAKVLADLKKEKAKRKRIILFTVLGAVLAAGIIAFIYAGIPALNLKKAKLSYEKTEFSFTAGEPMDKTNGDVKVAEYEGTELLFNPSNLTFKVSNKRAKTEWRSYLKNAAPGDDTALLYINYLGKDNNVYTWNTDTYCTQLGSYEVYPIENGVKIAMDVNEGESNRFYEYLPKKMSIERYEEFFVKGLEQALADGKISQEEYDRYSMTLGLVYKKSVMEECYAVTYVGKPPTSATKQMIAVAALLGYDKDMLEEDAEAFSFAIAKTEIARFYVNMYVTLEDGELVVRVPMSETESLNDYYKIQNIAVLPNFAACTPKQQEEGYWFVPDGAGALMKLNGFKSGVPGYERAVYNNDYFSDFYFMPEYREELMMPVFGGIMGELGSETASYLGIIEEGAESAYIKTVLASSGDEGSSTNRLYPTFDAVQFKRVKVYGAYSDNNANYLVSTKAPDVTFTVRYLFFGKEKGYYDMAAAYRDYLIKKDGLSLSYRSEPLLFLDMIGSLDVTAHFLGVPYNRTISMTSFKEASEILEGLSGLNIKAAYEGAFNGGMNNEVNTGARIVKKNGNKAALSSLNKNGNVSFGVNLSRVYDKTIGYRSFLNSAKDYSNSPAMISDYNVQSGLLQGYVSKNSGYYEIVSPYYLESVTDKFLKKTEEFGSLYIKDLASMPYGDYDNADMVDVHTGAEVTDRVLSSLSEGHSLTLDDPFMKNVKYADLITSVSRESSDYSTFAYTIPFRQLVLNGLCDFSTKNVNMSSRDEDYYVLQAAELAAIPQFTVSYKPEDLLKNSDYTTLYAINYANHKEMIERIYDKCAGVLKEIGTTEIAGHRLISEGVFETEYANGKKVMVNYNLYPVTLEDGTNLEAEGFVIR